MEYETSPRDKLDVPPLILRNTSVGNASPSLAEGSLGSPPQEIVGFIPSGFLRAIQGRASWRSDTVRLSYLQIPRYPIENSGRHRRATFRLDQALSITDGSPRIWWALLEFSRGGALLEPVGGCSAILHA